MCVCVCVCVCSEGGWDTPKREHLNKNNHFPYTKSIQGVGCKSTNFELHTLWMTPIFDLQPLGLCGIFTLSTPKY